MSPGLPNFLAGAQRECQCEREGSYRIDEYEQQKSNSVLPILNFTWVWSKKRWACRINAKTRDGCCCYNNVEGSSERGRLQVSWSMRCNENPFICVPLSLSHTGQFPLQKYKQDINQNLGWETREGKCLRLALLHAATTNINQFK